MIVVGGISVSNVYRFDSCREYVYIDKLVGKIWNKLSMNIM